MTCISTLRRVWPVSLCVNYESDDEEWPPPWPKISEKDNTGYETSVKGGGMQYAEAKPPLSPCPVHGNTPPPGHRAKTSNERALPVQSLPQQYYGLPADSRARSLSSRDRSRSRSRSQSRNRLVKPRTQSIASPRSRPEIGFPSDFRRVTGFVPPPPPVPRVPPMPGQAPAADSWRRIPNRPSRRVSRRMSRMGYRPLELAIHQPGNELPALPRFSRMVLDPGSNKFLQEIASRPASAVVRLGSVRDSKGRLRRSLSQRLSMPKRNLTPRMPLTRNSSTSTGSDVSFDDLESVVDPDFITTPAVQKRASRTPDKLAIKLDKGLQHIRPPVPLKTRSLLPSPREDKALVSPVSPQQENERVQQLKMDDFPSAFSSPTSPHASWQTPQDPFSNLDAAVAASQQQQTPTSAPPRALKPAPTSMPTSAPATAPTSVPYPHNTTNKVSNPDRSLTPHQNREHNRNESPMRHSPTPSNTSTISTAMSAHSTSARSASTDATGPPSPILDGKHMVGLQPPKPALLAAPLVAPTSQVRDVTVARVAADAPLMQPAPKIPGKSPRRLLPMIEEAQSPTTSIPQMPQPKRQVSPPESNVVPTVLHSQYGPQQLPQRPMPTAKPAGPQQPTGPQQPRQPPQPQRMHPLQVQPFQSRGPPPQRPPRADDMGIPQATPPPTIPRPALQQQVQLQQRGNQSPPQASNAVFPASDPTRRPSNKLQKKPPSPPRPFRPDEQPQHQISVSPPRPARPDAPVRPPRPATLELPEGPVPSGPRPAAQPAQAAAPAQSRSPPQTRSPPQQQAQLKPQQPAQPKSDPKTTDWSQTGSAWREVVWGLKRRTQEEAAIRAQEQHVIIDGPSDSASIASNEGSRPQEAPRAQPAPAGTPRGPRGPAHHRGTSPNGSNSGGSAGRSASRNGSDVMEVPVGLAVNGIPDAQSLGPAAGRSNEALLHLQPEVTHDMHAIAEEDEEEEELPKKAQQPKAAAPQKPSQPKLEAPKPQQKSQLSVVNASPTDQLDDDAESDDEGEEVEFGLDDGVWEMVESAPASRQASMSNARESVKVVSVHSNSTSSSPRQSRTSVYSQATNAPTASPAPPMPPIPDALGSFPVPPRTPASAKKPDQQQQQPQQQPTRMPKTPGAKTPDPRGQWGKGLGVEFGIAY